MNDCGSYFSQYCQMDIASLVENNQNTVMKKGDIGLPSVQIVKTVSGKGLWVCGPTTAYKDQLKNLGGKWNGSKKAWIFSLKSQQQLLDLFQLTETDISSETKANSEESVPEFETVTILKTASGKGLWVFGPTIPYKDQLKSLGGKWNSSRKAWIFNLATQQQLLDLFALKESDIGSE